MGFGQGLSGLNVAAQNLDVIGNNIANSGTVGFKAAAVSFSDVYASSRVGLGTTVSGVSQRFTTGTVNGGGGQYDIAIDGAKGMFRVTDRSGAVMYTRNGEFMVDKNSFIVNAQNHRLTGYPPGALGSNPVELQLPTANVAPKATSAATAVANLNANAPVIYQTDTVTAPEVPGSVTLNAVAYTFTKTAGGTLTWLPTTPPAAVYGTVPRTVEIDAAGQVSNGSLDQIAGFVDYTAAVTEVGKPFNPTTSTTYTNASPITAYDSLGNSHKVMQYFVKRAADAAGNSVYDAYYSMDGQAMTPTTETGGVWGNPVSFVFNRAGAMISPAMINLSFATPGGTTTPADPLAIAVDYTGTTQYGSDYVFKPAADGYSSGEFHGLTFAADGSLVADYTNGQTSVVGTIVLADFTNLQGLEPVGNNAWQESPESGQPILGQPGSNGMSKVIGQATEASNVDMSKELVSMIIAQRTYQANSQSIKTQDELMQILMNMK